MLVDAVEYAFRLFGFQNHVAQQIFHAAEAPRALEKAHRDGKHGIALLFRFQRGERLFRQIFADRRKRIIFQFTMFQWIRLDDTHVAAVLGGLPGYAEQVEFVAVFEFFVALVLFSQHMIAERRVHVFFAYDGGEIFLETRGRFHVYRHEINVSVGDRRPDLFTHSHGFYLSHKIGYRKISPLRPRRRSRNRNLSNCRSSSKERSARSRTE